MARLSKEVRSELRSFAFFMGNGTLSLDVLDGIEYSDQCGQDPSALEQMFAIWGNVLELDDDGRPVNSDRAANRAAQWLRSYLDPDYIVQPPFEPWEIELH